MHFIYIVPCSCYGKYVSCTTGTNFTPIRFYSNGVGVSQMLTPPVFTFQFGFILMERISSISISLNYFTFQSGFILIEYNFNKAFHANAFTFQSGFILIFQDTNTQTLHTTLHSNLVLF